mmetsp:Transcript_23143/g.57170  ORF Transcript_23143/g.57170 Transcript_23143/m.57170 type:complete len:308 (+) Transcript_23143:509-1432(+)
MRSACVRCEPGTTHRPPVRAVASYSETRPWTACSPRLVRPWSTCHQPPSVRCDGPSAPPIWYGRKTLPPSNELTSFSVPQIDANEALTAGSVLTNQQKREWPKPLPLTMPFTGSPTALKFELVQVVGASARRMPVSSSRNSQSRSLAASMSFAVAAPFTTTKPWLLRYSSIAGSSTSKRGDASQSSDGEKRGLAPCHSVLRRSRSATRRLRSACFRSLRKVERMFATVVDIRVVHSARSPDTVARPGCQRCRAAAVTAAATSATTAAMSERAEDEWSPRLARGLSRLCMRMWRRRVSRSVVCVCRDG